MEHFMTSEHIIGILLSAAFGAWAWVVRSFGQQHIETVKELGHELKELRHDMNKLGDRVTKMEVVTEQVLAKE